VCWRVNDRLPATHLPHAWTHPS